MWGLSCKYNEWLAANCDDELRQYGKSIPYIGWFWRYVDFSQDIDIGNCGDFVGFMVVNKWDHPERLMTEAEKNSIRTIIDSESSDREKCDDIWELMQEWEVGDE